MPVQQQHLKFNTALTAVNLGYTTSYPVAFGAIPGLSWYKVSADSMVLDGDGRVETWHATTGLGAPFSQTNPANRPTFVPDFLNGDPAITCNIANPDFMVWGDAMSIGAGAKHTKAAILRPAAAMAGTPGHILSIRNPASTEHEFLLAANQLANIIVANSGLLIASANTIPYDNWHLAIGGFDGTPGGASNTVSIEVDSWPRSIFTGTGAMADSRLVFAASLPTGGTNTWNGPVTDLFVSPAGCVHTDEDLAGFPQLARSYAFDEYGLLLPQ